MPRIITLSHQKGGVGKTTLSLNLYHYFVKQSVRCGLVDADPQGSITKLYERLGNQPNWGTLNILERKSFKRFEELEEHPDYDVFIIDTPPYLDTNLVEIYQSSDFVLIPCKCSPLDALAIEETIELVKQAQAVFKNLKAGIVINQSIQGTGFNDQVRGLLNQYDFPVLKTEIGNRVAYARSFFTSQSVFAEKNKKAAQEVKNLAKEIVCLLRK